MLRYVTAQNACLSPLLKLPTELRNQIWQYAFGNLKVHVSLLSFNKRAGDSHKDLIYTIWTEPQYPLHNASPKFKLPPAVCKQFYSEATAALYASNTFEFREPHSFRSFALSPHPCVSRVQHLSISCLSRDWKEALTSSIVGNLKSLRGVELVYSYWRCIERDPVPHATHPRWRGFWRIIRSFQQHQLEPHLTEFRVNVYNIYKSGNLRFGQVNEEEIALKPGEPQYRNLLQLQQELKAGLLQHVPRRLSRRGTERV